MTAPMAGIITALPVEEGEVAVIGTMNNAGTKLLTIADMSVVEAVMEVDETDVPNVKVGQRATVTIDAYPNKTFEGMVTEVGSSPMTANGAGSGGEAVNFEVKIQLTNPPAGVRPGFSASADIITGTRTKALAIPLQALVVREKPAPKVEDTGAGKAQEEEGVYVEKDGKVTFVGGIHRPHRRHQHRDHQRPERRPADRHRPLPRPPRHQGRQKVREQKEEKKDDDKEKT